MKTWKFTANAGFFGARRDRFNQYQPNRSLEEKIALVAQVEGLTGIELKYPADFADVALTQSLIADYGLVLSAVNVDTKDVQRFRHGALSNRQPETRQHAIQQLREGMDLAADLGVELVTTCPLSDGYDYPFQVDYVEAWDNFIETVRAVVFHRSDVTFLLEFQPHEPHAHVMLDNVGKVLHVCAEVGMPNVGANLDVGHSLAAGEAPAESAALLARKGLLRYLHSNDNTGDGGDWDMISGTVHFWHWVELLYTLDKVGYDGWIGGDITPKHISPVEAFQTNVHMIQRMTRLLERVGMDQIAELLQQDGNIAAVYDVLSEAMLP